MFSAQKPRGTESSQVHCLSWCWPMTMSVSPFPGESWPGPPTSYGDIGPASSQGPVGGLGYQPANISQPCNAVHLVFPADTPIEEFTPTPAFPALQYLESVDEGGVAWQAGLRTGDFLIEVGTPVFVSFCLGRVPALWGLGLWSWRCGQWSRPGARVEAALDGGFLGCSHLQ